MFHRTAGKAVASDKLSPPHENPMRTFLVSYDLAHPSLNRTYIADAIMSLGEAWARPLDNVWYVRSDATQREIEVRLSQLLDMDDGLLIQETRGDGAMVNTGLRWFRPRRGAQPYESVETNVVAFRGTVEIIPPAPKVPARRERIMAAS